MLDRGVRLVEILKQGQYVPIPVEKQVLIIYAATKGFVDKLEVAQLAAYEKGLNDFIEKKYPQIFETIRTKKAIDKDLEGTVKKALDEFATAFGGKREEKSEKAEKPAKKSDKKKG
jgi:F-type H+-transporting ATPase subunit alpha